MSFLKRFERMSGFTLLEVMVALAIFATTALALMKIGMNYTQSVMQNQLRTQAHFVAMNAAAEIQIQGKWITGTGSEDVTEQGAQWRITQTAFSTVSPDVQRIEIQIGKIDESQPDQVQGVSTLSIFNYRQPEVVMQ